MDIERLRALEKKWRDELPYKGSAWEERHDIIEDCADDLSALIAELGQEVGAVTNEMVLAAADAFLMHPGCVDQTVGHGPIRAALEAALTSPAHTSEARDAVPVKVPAPRYIDCPCCSSQEEHLHQCMPYFAAMRQEGGE